MPHYNDDKLNRILNNGMTVEELHAELGDMIRRGYGDTTVAVAHTSSDYWRTEVAQTVSEINQGVVSYSEYHNQLKVEEDCDEPCEHDGQVSIIVIS